MSRTPAARSPALPGELVASLDDAFAGEVALRLPRLIGASSRLSDGDPCAAEQILSDTHALGSSAAIVGEDLAAYAARECEQLLLSFDRDVTNRLAVIRITGAVDALRLALARWTDTAAHADLVPQQGTVRR